MLNQGHHNVNERAVPGLLPWQSYFLAFVLGILAYRYMLPAAVALGVLVVADTHFRGWLRRLPVLAFLLCAVFGFGYASQRALEPVDIPAWVEARKPVLVSGVVDRVEPRIGGRVRLVLRDMTYNLEGERGPLPAKLVWNWRSPDYEPVPGQAVAVRLRVVPARNFANPGAFDYEWFWQRQGVFWRAWPAGKNESIQWGEPPEDWLWTAKRKLRRAVSDFVPASQDGAMVLALVTGDRSSLDQATSEATRSAGLAHTLALSGLHVGFVAALGAGLAWLVGWLYPPLLLSIPRPKLAVVLAAPLVLAYAWLGQPSQSLIRAAVMFAFWGFLLLQGRGRVLMDGLFFALVVIIFWTPFAVFDLSLQMSAVAVAGIGLMYPKVRALFFFGHTWWQRLFGWAGGLLGVSLCANLALLPLTTWNFGSWSPNILLNLVWIPVLGMAVMPMGLLGMILSPFAWTASLGGWLLQAASTCVGWLLELLRLTSEGGMVPVFTVFRPLWPEIVGVGLLLVVAVVAWNNRRAFVGLAGLGLLLMVWPHCSVMLSDARDEVKLTLIDVGLGQSAVISLPGGHRWLVDGGRGSKTFDMGESVVAPYLTYGRPPRLDGVFMSHPDADHSHGLPFILSRFEVGAFYTNGMLPRGRTGKELRKVLEEHAMNPIVLKAGQRIGLGEDVSLEIIHPEQKFEDSHANERSLVMRLVRGDKGLALLPGDIERSGVKAVMASGLPYSAEVVVLPHHGSKTSYVAGFFEEMSPLAALCSNGYLNQFGFPHSAVTSRTGAPVFTTSRHGLLAAIWDEEAELSIMAFRP